MPQLRVKMKGREWDSGVGRDDTYGKCGKKERKAEGAESAAAFLLLG
jgi:hypothetical protein